MKSLLYTIIVILAFSTAEGSPKNIIKFEREYDPNLIVKKQKNISFNNTKKVDSREICKKFKCKDVVEVIVDKTIASDKNKYRLRNSWFNHQGILLDDLSISNESITMNTVVSNAYILESYLINRVTGETEKKFYRFDNSEFFQKISELKKNNSQTLFNKDGRLSLKTLKSFSLEPWEVIYFKGKCLEGTGI